MRALRNTPGVAAQERCASALPHPGNREPRLGDPLPDEARRVDEDNLSRVREAINLSGEA